MPAGVVTLTGFALKLLPVVIAASYFIIIDTSTDVRKVVSYDEFSVFLLETETVMDRKAINPEITI